MYPIEMEICQGKEVFKTWSHAIRILRKMRRKDRKANLCIYRCRTDCTHFHIGSTLIRQQKVKALYYAQDDEEGD